MAAILRDSTVVVVAVVRTRPRAIPLSVINHEKIHTWVSFSYMVMGLRLAALRAAGAPLSRDSFLGCILYFFDILYSVLGIFSHLCKRLRSNRSKMVDIFSK